MSFHSLNTVSGLGSRVLFIELLSICSMFGLQILWTSNMCVDCMDRHISHRIASHMELKNERYSFTYFKNTFLFSLLFHFLLRKSFLFEQTINDESYVFRMNGSFVLWLNLWFVCLCVLNFLNECPLSIQFSLMHCVMPRLPSHSRTIVHQCVVSLWCINLIVSIQPFCQLVLFDTISISSSVLFNSHFLFFRVSSTETLFRCLFTFS